MSFETAITWDSANWTRPQKRSAAGIVSPALDYTKESLSAMGILASIPYKTVRICQAARNYDAAGETSSALQFDINFNVIDIRRNKLHRVAKKVPGIVFHELVHCIRYENYNDNTPFELASSEGLAYVLEDLFEEQHVKLRILHLDKEIPDTVENMQLANHFAESLIASETAFTDLDELSDEFRDSWEGPFMNDFTALEFMGIMAVRRGLEQGNSPADLIQAEASDILSFLE